jgi:hypothetical protein
MRGPSTDETEGFVDLVRSRNNEGLRQLVRERLPDVVWGEVIKKLTDEERSWSFAAITTAQS